HGHGMTLGWVANRGHTLFEKILQHHALRIRRASNDEIAGRISPILTEPIDIGLKSARADHYRLWPHGGRDAALDGQDLADLSVIQTKRAHFSIVEDADSETLGGSVVRVQES